MTYDVRVIIGGAAVLGTAIGAVSGYFVAVRRLEAQYDQRLTEEIARTKEQYKMVAKVGEYSDPEVLAKKYETRVKEKKAFVEALDEVAYSEESDSPEGEVVVRRVEFTSEPETEEIEIDFEAERPTRESGEPYVISFDEFNDENPTFAKITLSYFAGDDTLVDDQDIPVEDIEYTIGGEALERFGHGSKDPRVVYVRNEYTSSDFEITKTDGSYEEFVMGGTLEHEDKVRKFRGGYE